MRGTRVGYYFAKSTDSCIWKEPERLVPGFGQVPGWGLSELIHFHTEEVTCGENQQNRIDRAKVWSILFTGFLPPTGLEANETE